MQTRDFFMRPLESSDSNNPGNLILNRNVELKEQWGKMNYFQELPKTIQNELIESILEKIQCYIDRQINNVLLFSHACQSNHRYNRKVLVSAVLRFIDTLGQCFPICGM